MAKTKPPAGGDRGDYDRHRADMAEKSRQRAQKGRDIAPIPDIADVRRRARCRGSLRLFCKTYNPELFYLPWSGAHLNAIGKLEETVLHGALYAFAMPRGFGKTSLCRMAALWAISYRLVRYVYMIGANAGKGEENLDAIKLAIRFLPKYVADFPEIAFPAVALGGIANRAGGQLCDGESTLIEWSADRIVLPTVPPPSNWPKSWALRADGKVPTAGSVVMVSGLTGDGIRGSLLTLSTGEAIRPDLVLLDDPQTDESAGSPAQCDSREALIAGAVLGMAGPDKPISAFMPCTIIKPGDMADRLLDRSKHPLWRGEKTALLESMPSSQDALDAYFEVYREAMQCDPPDYAAAAAHWRAHRAELEAGAVATWPARKLDTDVSAIQYAANLLCRSPRAFWSEYQNAPLIDEEERRTLSAAEIVSKANGIVRGLVPLWATRLTAFLDLHGELLFWAVAGWREDFTGHLVEYGTFPDQRGRSYFTLRDARPTLADETGAASLEACVFQGLTLATDQLLARVWTREDGSPLRIERLLVDSGWQTELVRQWVRQCGRAEITASVGHATKPTASPISAWKVQPGQRKGLNWLLSKHVVFDPNFWKTFVFARLATAEPMPGCLTLHADLDSKHALLLDHLTAERPTEVESRGRTVDVWEKIPNRDNHWLDCLVGCAVAASVQGVALAELPASKPRGTKTVSYRQLYDQAKAAQGRPAPAIADVPRIEPAPASQQPKTVSYREMYQRARGTQP